MSAPITRDVKQFLSDGSKINKFKPSNWKKVKLNPNVYNDEKFGNLVSFSELTDYNIDDFVTDPLENQDTNSEDASPSKKHRKIVKNAKVSLNNNAFSDSKAQFSLKHSNDFHENKHLNFDNKGEATRSDKNKTRKRKNKNRFKNEDVKKCKVSESKNNDSNPEEKHITESDLTTWQGLFVPPAVLKALADSNFTCPLPIQALALPFAIRDHKDIMGAAETGSGKTLAFVIPMIHFILNWKEKHKDHETNENGNTGPLLGLILTPTRELAVQVKQHIMAVIKYTDIQVLCVVGGLSAQKQHRLLRRCPDIVIATPGRLWELIESGQPHLNALDHLLCFVIDEADRMVEKGHFKDLSKLLDLLNESSEKIKKRHTYVYSATLALPHPNKTSHITKQTPDDSNQFEVLMNKIGIKNDAKVIDITKKSIVSESLTETRINCDIHEKDLYLFYFIKTYPGRTLVFTNSKDCIRRLISVFTILECHPLPLHAGMHQKQRLKNLERFTASDKVVLIATDVASRGLDIPDIQHVVHYQAPRSVENYVHRSGRTARVSKEGLSVMLVSPDDAAYYRNIVYHTRGKDLPLFPVSYGDLGKFKMTVNMAQDIDTLQHRTSKMKRENDWFTKLAKDVEVDLEEDSDLLYNFSARDAERNKKRLKSMKQELSRMLKQCAANKDFIGKFPTEMAPLRPLTLSAEKSDAISCVKQKQHEENKMAANVQLKSSRRRRGHRKKSMQNKTNNKKLEI